MILVCGTGRSGTSEVAEILDKLGVNMGHAFHMGDEFNKRGYFEDREFQAKNLAFYMMHLDEVDDKRLWKLWRTEFKKLIDSRKEPWGVKDPGIADFPKLLAEYMKLNPQIILCSRDREEAINSFMRMKSISRKKAEKIYDTRIKNLKTALKNVDYLDIDCYDKNKREKLLAYLKI